MFDPPETKKGYGLFIHSLLGFDLSVRGTETKKAMGAWKPPMAFAFKSNNHSSTGQASFMFAQHHQLPCLILNIFST
jgi:hypothetical protein